MVIATNNAVITAYKTAEDPEPLPTASRAWLKREGVFCTEFQPVYIKLIGIIKTITKSGTVMLYAFA